METPYAGSVNWIDKWGVDVRRHQLEEGKNGSVAYDSANCSAGRGDVGSQCQAEGACQAPVGVSRAW